jgi:hypothetical protein
MRLCEPVSVTYRTGLRHVETEIGKWRAETDARKPPAGDQKPQNCRPETRAHRPNPPECRRFSHTWKSHRRDRNGWLRVKRCLRDDVGITTGVAQIAADLPRRPDRQGRANNCRLGDPLIARRVASVAGVLIAPPAVVSAVAYFDDAIDPFQPCRSPRRAVAYRSNARRWAAWPPGRADEVVE